MQFIDLQAQYTRYQEEIDSRMRAVLEHGRYIMGPEVKELEEKLAEFTGTKYCIAVSSGTQSLELALRALEIAPGAEGRPVPFSWMRLAGVVMLGGAAAASGR